MCCITTTTTTDTSNKPYVCYLLTNEERRHTYVGITNNIERRLRQHNGEIQGGAKRTRNRGIWTVAAYVSGFHNKSQALSFEWHMHHPRPRRYVRGVQGRTLYARKLMTQSRFAHLHLHF